MLRRIPIEKRRRKAMLTLREIGSYHGLEASIKETFDLAKIWA